MLSFPKLDRRLRRDLLRVAAQTAAAVVATVLLMRWLQLPQMTWAVISALFSMRLEFDATVGAGLSRILAALLGTAIGLATVGLFDGPYEILLSVAVASVAANMLATLWPNLKYAVVAAAIIALHADTSIASALERAVAIMLGSAVGTAATLLIWPEFGRTRALRHAADALEDCRRMLESSLRRTAEAEAEDPQRIDDDFSRHIQLARETVAQTRVRPRLSTGPTLREAVVGIERLWSGIIVLNRVAEGQADRLHDDAVGDLSSTLKSVLEATESYLDALSAFLEGHGPAPSPQEVFARISEAEASLKPGRQMADDQEAREAVSAFRFGMDEVRKNVREVSALAGEAGEDGSEGGGSGKSATPKDSGS